MRFILRTLSMLITGALLPLAVLILGALLICLAAAGLGCALLLIWSGVDGVLWLMTHDKRIAHDGLQAFLAGSIGFGLTVAFYSMVIDGFRRLTRKKTGQALSMSFANS